MKLLSAVDYQEGRIVATDLVKNDNGQATLLAFDKDSTIALHKAPGDVLVQVLEGDVEFAVEGEKRELKAGEYLTLSVGTQHEVYAVEQSKVLLTIVKTDVCDCGCQDNKQAEELLPEA